MDWLGPIAAAISAIMAVLSFFKSFTAAKKIKELDTIVNELNISVKNLDIKFNDLSLMYSKITVAVSNMISGFSGHAEKVIIYQDFNNNNEVMEMLDKANKRIDAILEYQAKQHKITVSNAPPSDGHNGDIWYQYH